jgi:hypothetical protein
MQTINDNNLTNLIINKKNISFIYNKLLKTTSINPIDSNQKSLLLEQIVNELRQINAKVVDKIGNKTKPQIKSIVDKINEHVIRKVVMESTQPSISEINMKRQLDIITPNPSISGYVERPLSTTASNYDFSDDKKITEQRYNSYLANRNELTPQVQRPPTPDFSLDGSGKKKKQINNQNSRQTQMETNDLETFNSINENFTLDNYTTGINSHEFNIDESVPVDQLLKRYETERNNQSDNNLQQPIPQFVQQQPQYNQLNNFQQQEINYDMDDYIEQPKPRKSNKNYTQSNQNIDNIVQMHLQNYKQMFDNQQIQLINEINSLKQQIVKTTDNDLMSQIQALNYELQQYKSNNTYLQNKLKELNSNLENADKFELLEQKKTEIIIELNRLKDKHIELDNIIKQQTEHEEKLDTLYKNIESQIYNNQELLLNDNHTIFVDLDISSIITDHDKFIYNFENPIENVNMIQLVDHNIKEFYFNIIDSNNKFYFSANEIIEDEPSNIHIYHNNFNDIVYCLIIESGHYEIESLLKYMNKSLKTFNIILGFTPSNNIVQIKTTNEKPINVYCYENNIMETLGYLNTNDNYINFTTLKGANPFKLKTTKFINIYIENINSNKPISKININEGKIINNYTILKPSIKKINNFIFIFKDDHNSTYEFQQSTIKLEFKIYGIYKNTIRPENQTDNLNESMDNSNQSLLERINEMLVIS